MQSSQHYINTLNPIAFNAFGLSFSWYWVVYLIGLLWFIVCFKIIRGEKLTRLNNLDFSFVTQWAWLGLFVGARLGYILIYNFSFYRDNPGEVFKFWHGGMSFHGGVVGLVVCSYFATRFRKINLLHYLDIVALSTPIIIGFGRLANFINGELIGRISDLPWAVIFPRVDLNPRHPSQLYQAFLEGFLLFFILWRKRSVGLPRPGFTSCYFLIGYGFLRFMAEFFRLADPQIGHQVLNLTMGQWLCLLMIAAGIILMKSLKNQDK